MATVFVISFVGAFSHADVLDSITATPSDIRIGSSDGGNGYDIFWGYRPAASHNVCSVTMPLRMNGSPVDSLALDINIGTTTYPSFGDDYDPVLHQHADSQFQISSTTYQDYTFTFSPCAVVVGLEWYSFHLYRTGAAAAARYEIRGRDGSGAAAVTSGTAQWVADRLLIFGSERTFHANVFPEFAPSISINGTENFGVSALSNPQLGIGNILSAITDANASTTLLSSVGGFINIPQLLRERVPFAYLYEIRDLLNTDNLPATSQFAAVTISFPTSSVSMFNVGTITVFSTSSITQLVGPTLWSIIYGFVEVTMYVGLLGMFWMSRHQFFS